jgi:hypothetical protein
MSGDELPTSLNGREVLSQLKNYIILYGKDEYGFDVEVRQEGTDKEALYAGIESKDSEAQQYYKLEYYYRLETTTQYNLTKIIRDIANQITYEDIDIKDTLKSEEIDLEGGKLVIYNIKIPSKDNRNRMVEVSIEQSPLMKFGTINYDLTLRILSDKENNFLDDFNYLRELFDDGFLPDMVRF